MAKKVTRPNLPQETLERARRELARTGVVVDAPAPDFPRESAPAASAAPAPRMTVRPQTDLRADYAYVLSDLRNMATLAGIMIAVLIALSFVI